MTEKLFDLDSALKEFTATVLSCEEYFENWAVVLDKTAFFPEAGGQKSDRGILGGAKVIDVQIENEIITHITDAPLKVGETVEGILDYNRRFDFMQQHTGEHIVSGAAHRLFGCTNVGFHLSEDIVTVDFDKALTKEDILKIEQEANKKVFANTPVRAYYPDDEALEKLEYRSKKELEGAIRIVEIVDADMCACCAPHVKATGEVGLIKLLDFETLRGGVRIEMKCGMRALDDYNDKYKNIQKIANDLCVKQTEAGLGVDRLFEQISALKYELNGLKKRELDNKINAFMPDGDKTAMFADGLEIKDLQTAADTLYKKTDGIRGVFSPKENGFAFAICGNESDLQPFFTRFKATFTVKGGGRGPMVQGSVEASEENIKEFFKNA